MHKVNPHTKLCFGIIVLCLLNIVTVVALSSNAANADSTSSASSTASITVPEACTMTSINNTPHIATLSPNTYSGASGSEYQNGIGKTTLTATCNDDNGFAIYAIGYTGNSYDSENHNKLVGQSTNVAINTAVYTSGDTTSSWSMKVNKINDSTVSYNPQNMSILDSFDSWHIVPDTYTKVAQYHANTGSSTTDTTLGAKVETTYAAYIASNQPADTYIGQVKYTMVHPNNEVPAQSQTCAAGYICYYANTVTAEGTMDNQTIATSDTGITLLASNFSRRGYGFAGWSNKYDYATNTDSDLKFYGPQETITFTAGEYTGDNDGLALYAVWIKSQGILQDASKVATVCSGLTQVPTNGTANLSSVSALTDQRDNETYAIAKLADGNCWMIENLRLESTNSDNSTGALAQGYGTSATYGSFSGLADAENSNFNATDPPIANSLYSPSTDGNKIVIGASDYSYARMPRYNNTNTSARASYPVNNNSSLYSYGNYYTWSAALANTANYYGPTSMGSDGKTSETVNTSLCPFGWRLPRGGDKWRESTNDFWSLIVTGINGGTKPINYDSSTTPNYERTEEASIVAKKLRTFPNNFVYSGGFHVSSPYISGSGSYWSSTSLYNLMSYGLNFSDTNVRPGNNSFYKIYGYSIRCMASLGS